MLEKIILDADICLKLGGSGKYRMLYDLIPMLSCNVYIHKTTLAEIKYPIEAKAQILQLVAEGKVSVVSQDDLEKEDRKVYDMTHAKLSRVMKDPTRPNKNMGEVCALAYAKTKSIPLFATDERNLQTIIDKQLNTGVDDIHCLRIQDIVENAKDGVLGISRKQAKLVWAISGKDKEAFDRLWPNA